MSEVVTPQVAIVDYRMGNLFSVYRACEEVGLTATITEDPAVVRRAQAVVLPGVGAFGDAMATLQARGLTEVLRETATSGKPLLGICLGMQLLMSRSEEFGWHAGLGIIEGDVVRLSTSCDQDRMLKVPQIGWNRIARPSGAEWEGTVLEGLSEGVFFYFVHSFYVRPADPRVVLAHTQYGPTTFCSALRHENVMACQFHPERSGPAGLRVYRNLASLVNRSHRMEERYA